MTAAPADGSVITTVEAGLRSDGAAERGLRRRLLAALIVGVLSMAAMIGVSIVFFLQNLEHGRWVDHTYAAQAKISDLATDIERVETARRGALLNPSDGSYRKTYDATVGQVLPELEDLAHFTRDNPRQRVNIEALRPLIAAKRVQLVSTMQLIAQGRAPEARALFLHQAQLRLTQQMRQRLAAMDAEEGRLLKVRSARERATTSALLALTLSSLALLAVVVAFAGLLMWRYAADLSRSQAALRRLNEGLEGAVRDRTAELTRANAEIQRFAYIVSHDLRSPLVNVMGFTSELETTMDVLRGQIARTDEMAPGVLRPETRTAVFEDMPEAIGFIRSSTRKMDRLINAILALSRQGRRTLNPEPLDMDALAQGVADSLRQLADDRGATVTVEAPLPDLVHDRLAVEQVLSNVMENAVKYASTERPGRVVVRGRAEGGRAVLEVSDNGRGVDPKDHERIFDLFRRAGQQDQPGEGIGLAHVRALVYRLGGAISIDSELGRGATFRIDLPRRLGREDS